MAELRTWLSAWAAHGLPHTLIWHLPLVAVPIDKSHAVRTTAVELARRSFDIRSRSPQHKCSPGNKLGKERVEKEYVRAFTIAAMEMVQTWLKPAWTMSG